MNRNILVSLLMALCLALSGCNNDPGGSSGGGGPRDPDSHTHTYYAAAWSFNATQHWKECTANDGAKNSEDNHTDDPCAVCGYDSSKPSVTFSSLTANGSAAATITTLTLTLSAAIPGLSANDITLNGVAGVQKGTLSGAGPTYTLPITISNGYTAGGTLSAAVSKTGYNISGSIKMVTILYILEMVHVPGGSFEMGKELNPNNGSSDKVSVHTVTLTGFYIGKYEVTQAQWQAVMGYLPPDRYGYTYTHGKGNNYPVYGVSWYDALVFCNTLSMAEGLTPAYSISGSTDPAAWGYVPYTYRNDETWDAVEVVSGSTGYRLPTAAQWEYAAKGGNGSPGNYTYAGSNNVYEVGWVGWVEHGPDPWFEELYGEATTHAVGTKAPNGLGIYDMSGNVMEWCWDTATSSGDMRVLRGGSWLMEKAFARSVESWWLSPSHRRSGGAPPYEVSDDQGFRVVRPAQ